MTTEKQLNEKLARWAGFKENRFDDPPMFTNSLDACCNWLVPKLGLCDITFSQNHEVNYYGCHILANVPPPYRFQGEGKTPSLALCRAIEQLIDKEKP